MSKTHTAMQSFALQLIKEKGKLYPGTLANEWSMHKHGRYSKAASRDSFGLTSASYKTLRSLRDQGLLISDNDHEYKINPDHKSSE